MSGADPRKTLGTLALLTAALPFNAALVGVALAWRAASPPRRRRAAEPKTILLSGGKMTKALALARAFHGAGHRVVLAETARYRLTGHRFSNAVDAFRVLPKPDDPGYVDALERIVREEGVDVYVPVCAPASAYWDAQAKARLDGLCEVLHFDPPDLERLDDKHRLAETADGIGLPVPDYARITDPAQVAAFDFGRRPDASYVLKSIPYDPVRRMDLTPLPRPTPAETDAFARALPIGPDTPFILQELVRGDEYCTHSTVRDGRVQLHVCCRSSAFQLNYAHVDRPEILAWVQRLVGALGVTGQVSMDFIVGADGTPLAIECNPRTHSAITLFDDPVAVADAYLLDGVERVEPRPGVRPTYWLYHELWRLLSQPGKRRTLGTILRGRDAIFSWDDPLPFLLAHHLQLPRLLLGNLVKGRPWVKIDFNIGKLVEPGGD